MRCETTQSIGAYLLGAVDYSEWTEIDRHVRHCDVCRAEIVQLAGLPGLIGRVPLDDVTGAVPTPPARGPRSAPRRRTLRLVAAAAVVVAAVGIFAGIELGGRGGSAGTATSTWSTTFALSGRNAAAHVSGGASLTAESWGTELWVKVEGVPAGTQCSLVVHARDGRTIPVGQWMSASTKPFWVPASASLPRAAIARIDVITPAGTVLALTPGPEPAR